MNRTRTLVVVAATVLALAACGDDAGDSVAPTTPTTPTPPIIEWEDLGTVDLGDGWELADAEGDGPFVAIRRAGATVGVIEVARFPIDTVDAVDAVLDAGGSEADALAAHAEEYLAIFEADRREGCGPDYAFVPEPTTSVDGVDGPLVRYGFVGGAPATERNLHWAGIRGGELVLVTVAAAEPGGCLPPEGPGLTIADLAEVEPRLAGAIEASPLPA